jgi:signal transduction histidine kinase
VGTKAEKDLIFIEVADNGPGIPEEIKDKILQPFFTTKKGTEGTGLGLSITHDIIKAHGGNSISVPRMLAQHSPSYYRLVHEVSMGASMMTVVP